MSRKLEYSCDRCKRVGIKPVHKLDLGQEPLADLKTAEDTHGSIMDLCSECWMGLIRFLKAEKS